MPEYDVVIVGGGPAGSSAAMAAARAGASTILYEKEQSIAETVRTSGVTWMQNVKEFGIPEYCYNPVKNFGFASPNNEIMVKNAEPLAAVLDVRGTYRWLAEEAQNAGAIIHTGAAVTAAARNGGRIALACNGEEIHSKMVVDASGFQSIVSRDIGAVEQWSRFGAGAEYEAEVDSMDSDTWWLLVGEKYSPAGYAWIFPLGNNIVRIGVGVGKPESDADPKILLDRMIAEKTGPIKGLGKITPKEFHYGLIPNDGLSRTTTFDGLLLAGDSAGQANPLVLEGIRHAIRYGREAGRTAAKAAKTGQTSAKHLYPYEKKWRSEIESKVKSAKRIQDRWLGLDDAQWDRELDIIRELSPDEFLDFIRADFGMYKMLKLAASHPKMAARQLFGLISPR